MGASDGGMASPAANWYHLMSTGGHSSWDVMKDRLMEEASDVKWTLMMGTSCDLLVQE